MEQTPVIYSLKVIRIVFIWFALYLTSKIFQEQYVSKVFANSEDPPNLMGFIGIFLGIETGMMMLLFVFLFLINRLNGNTSVINTSMLKKYAVDYVFVTIFIITLGLMISSLMMKKKYFRYKTDGLRAIRCLQETMFYIGVVISAIPFFFVM
jgi:uncharacterized membrane protein